MSLPLRKDGKEQYLEDAKLEILKLKEDVGKNLLAIGKKLIDVRSRVKRGEWERWLESVNIAKVKAWRLMELVKQPQLIEDKTRLWHHMKRSAGGTNATESQQKRQGTKKTKKWIAVYNFECPWCYQTVCVECNGKKHRIRHNLMGGEPAPKRRA